MKAKAFQIINNRTGRKVGELKTLMGAKQRRDKEDEKAGRLCHSLRPVQPE